MKHICCVYTHSNYTHIWHTCDIHDVLVCAHVGLKFKKSLYVVPNTIIYTKNFKLKYFLRVLNIFLNHYSFMMKECFVF